METDNTQQICDRLSDIFNREMAGDSSPRPLEREHANRFLYGMVANRLERHSHRPCSRAATRRPARHWHRDRGTGSTNASPEPRCRRQRWQGGHRHSPRHPLDAQRLPKGLWDWPDNPWGTVMAARSLWPQAPMELDGSWLVGFNWCSPKSPNCGACPLDDICPSSAAS